MLRGLGQNFNLRNAAGPLPVGRAHTVGACVAAAYYNYLFINCYNKPVIGDKFPCHTPVLLFKVFHGEVYSINVVALNVEFPRFPCANGYHHSVVF